MLEVLLALILAQNPSCKAETREFLFWSDPSQAIVETMAVPLGKVWLVRAAGLFTNDGAGANYAMEIVRPVRSQGDVCCWRIPIEGMRWAQMTPLVALSRPVVLHEGEKMAGRSTRAHAFGIDLVYYELPKECVP